jgi:two-component system NtrC family sensor kinase
MTLKTRFNLFIFLGIFIFLLNIPVVYFEITTSNRHLADLELSENLYENVLEIRRYEKNFLLYHDRDSVDSIRAHLELAESLVAEASDRLRGSTAGDQVDRLGEALDDYAFLGEAMRPAPATDLDDETRKELRITGQKIVFLSAQLLRNQRRQVTVAANNALRWPLITMGAILLLFMAGAWTTIVKVVRPLSMIEEATGRVARGDYSPIPYTAATRTYVDHLVEAFNQMAQGLEAREEQVIHSRKIASLGTLVSGVAHELNNPINNIVLTADVINSRRGLSTERCAAMMRDVLDQALRASEIVKNLLEFSRAQSAGHEELDLAALLRESVQISENHMVLSHVAFHDEIEDGLPRVNGSRQGLQQVFLNLITNAVHALEDGGDLTIRARREGDDRVMVEVEDTGIGIAEEDVQRIFDPFFTTKEVGKGTGLGLSVSFGIIKKHGGRISVRSKLGQGTTFTIDLPIVESPSSG